MSSPAPQVSPLPPPPSPAALVLDTLASIEDAVAWFTENGYATEAALYPRAVAELAESYWWRAREYHNMRAEGIVPLDLDEPIVWLNSVIAAQAAPFSVGGADMKRIMFRHVFSASVLFHNWIDDPAYRAAAEALNAWNPVDVDISVIAVGMPLDQLKMAVFIAGQRSERAYNATKGPRGRYGYPNAETDFWNKCWHHLADALRHRASKPTISSTDYVKAMFAYLGLGPAGN